MCASFFTHAAFTHTHTIKYIFLCVCVSVENPRVALLCDDGDLPAMRTPRRAARSPWWCPCGLLSSHGVDSGRAICTSRLRARSRLGGGRSCHEPCLPPLGRWSLSRFHPLWLLDNCSSRRHPGTRQKLQTPADLPPSVHIAAVETSAESLSIQWEQPAKTDGATLVAVLLRKVAPRFRLFRIGRRRVPSAGRPPRRPRCDRARRRRRHCTRCHTFRLTTS